ncbi:hypothetical protein FJT64_006188 [Amphibalanus amphitrite]|uniref:Uncharacterized protein n=1 Tax=Amphibalanus amphitrite TaxID=1232801 RepID=A0A6A4VQ66_AMPAM|nr:hypothetical protein FJT64_006188 [Amphibalanus amphitrite]
MYDKVLWVPGAMDDPDLYDDILGGTLSTERPRCVEVLLEVGVHRRVLRLPENTSSPLSAVRTAAARLLGSDAGLRDSLGSEHLVFQRRSLKFDTWVDMVAVGERPVADGERLRALTKKVLEAGEVMSSDGETVSEQAWQHMDPEFAKQLREYELDQARRQDNEELRRHLSELVEISDGDLSVSDDEPPPASGASAVVSELGQRVLDRLKKLREEFGGGDQAESSADKESDEAPEEKPEPTLSKGGPLYASFLNLESKHPPMALNEYCTAREWEAPVFHLTEKPSNSKKQKMFTAAYCLQKLGVLKGGEVYKRMEGEQDVI